MSRWLRENRGTVGWCVMLIVAAIIFFRISEGSQYQQLAIGILASSVTLVVALLVFEILWWIGATFVDALEKKSKFGHPEKG